MPDDDFQPELYQLVGSALRDVAQARFTADLFSRQIAFVYESDGVLRRFPVPRVDIDEAELTLHFAVRTVAVDPARQSTRNANIGALFDQYSGRIVRATMQLVREQTKNARAALTDEASISALAAFEKRFLSDEHRDLLTGRLVQYLNDSTDKIIRPDCTLNVKQVLDDLDSDVTNQILKQDEAQKLATRFQPAVWSTLLAAVQKSYSEQIESLAADIEKLRDRYPDYRITIDPAPRTGDGAPPLSTLRIRSSVRNYKWSKVDVDEADLRNIRTLNPE